MNMHLDYIIFSINIHSYGTYKCMHAAVFMGNVRVIGERQNRF